MIIYLKLLVAVILGAITAPFVFHSVSEAARFWLTSTDLSAWNPGNGAGLLVGVSAASLSLFVLSGILSSLHDLDEKRYRTHLLQESLHWLAAIGVSSAVVVATYRAVSAVQSPQLAVLFSIFVAAFGGGLISRWKFPPYPFDPYIRGPKLYSAKAVKQKRGDRPVTCAPHGADYISVEDETKHYLILGKIGGGKTTQFSMLMTALSPVPGLWAVSDPKGEVIPFLKAIGRTPIIFNPYDTRCVKWAMQEDIVNPAQAMSLASMIVPISPEIKEPFFPQTAQGLVQGVTTYLIHLYKEQGRPWDLRDVCLLCEDKELMKRAFKRLPTTRPLLEYLEDGSGARNDYLSTLTTNLRPWRIIAALWFHAAESYSITRLVENADQSFEAIVYGFDYEENEPLQELNRLLFELQKQRVMNLPDDKSRRLRWFLDEVSKGSHHLGALLLELLALARSKGGCLYLGTQDTAGLVQAFGKEALSQIWVQCQHKAVVGGVDPETAEFVSEAIGMVEYIETETSISKTKASATSQVDEFKRPDSDKDVSVQYVRRGRSLISKAELVDIPLTNGQNGMTGLFIGGEGGLHWYRAEWEEIESMTVPPLDTVSRYERVRRDSNRYYLKPFTDDELRLLGL